MNLNKIIIDNLENIDHEIINPEDLKDIIEEWGLKEEDA